jgi:hypothetical protein
MKPLTRILLAILWILSLFYFSSLSSDLGKVLGFIFSVIIGTIIQLEDVHIQDLKSLFKIK